MQKVSELPDVAKSPNLSFERVIDWVGMGDVESSLKLKEQNVQAQVDVFVDLADPKAKGIHMSRLYLAVLKDLKKEELNEEVLKELLIRLIEEQEGNSLQSKIKLNFKLPLLRKALVSQSYGERHYPVSIEASALKTGEGYHFEIEVDIKVLYSSTCPCSAALARKLIKAHWEDFAKDKQEISKEEVADWLDLESSLVATPHAQRSEAHLKFLVEKVSQEALVAWIDKLEKQILKTPVQTAVKREDEQEFARLNGTNLMFCEDAARRVAQWLDQDLEVQAYWAKMEHRESLHAHNAVSVISNNWRF